MALPYYVEPEYWEEGYAIGDAKLVSGTASAALSVSASAARIQNVAALVAAQISMSAVTSVTFLGQASISSSLTVSASGVRVREASSTGKYYVDEGYWQPGYENTATGQLAVSASASLIALGSATVNCSAALAATVNRVQFTSASTAISAIFTASARLKWEPEPDTPETWTDIPAASGIWTDVPDTSETWTEVA